MKKILTILLIILLGIPLPVYAKGKVSDRQKVINMIKTVAENEKVDVAFCLAIGRIESNFNADAFNDNTFNFTKNHKDPNVKYGSQEKYVSRGVMQLTFDTGRKFNKKIRKSGDLYDPQKNIVAGVKFIKYLIEKYPNFTMAQIAQLYNLGESSYFRGKRNSDYETKFLKWYYQFSLSPNV